MLHQQPAHDVGPIAKRVDENQLPTATPAFFTTKNLSHGGIECVLATKLAIWSKLQRVRPESQQELHNLLRRQWITQRAGQLTANNMKSGEAKMICSIGGSPMCEKQLHRREIP